MKRLLVIASTIVTTAAHADVQITMRAGSQCWSHQGTDSRFFGNFSAGQAIATRKSFPISVFDLSWRAHKGSAKAESFGEATGLPQAFSTRDLGNLRSISTSRPGLEPGPIRRGLSFWHCG